MTVDMQPPLDCMILHAYALRRTSIMVYTRNRMARHAFLDCRAERVVA